MSYDYIKLTERNTRFTNDNIKKIIGGNIQRLKSEANDLVKTFTYLDAGAADERVSTIVYSSASLGLSVTETFVYAGSAGSYRVSTITLS